MSNPGHMSSDKTVSDLIMHIKDKIDKLPILVDAFKLGEDQVKQLKDHLMEELDILKKIDPSKTLHDTLLEGHHESGRKYNGMIKNFLERE